MNDTTMTCDRVDSVLSSYLEGSLEARARSAVDAHLASCLRCAALVRDLRAIEQRAAQMPELSPTRDLWPEIEARIATPVIQLTTAEHARMRDRRTARLAAAAVILVAVTAGTTYLLARGGGREAAVIPVARVTDTAAPRLDSSATSASRTTAPRPVTTVARQKDVPAVVTYDREITALRGVLELRRNDLDPATVAILENSLLVIDRAIADARAAVAKDSASAFLHDQLNQALEKKLGLLRTVALLPPRT